MTHAWHGRLTWSDWSIIGAIALLAVLCAVPGVHLAALWLAPLPATLVSHGAAVVGLAIAFGQWRLRRRRARS